MDSFFTYAVGAVTATLAAAFRSTCVCEVSFAGLPSASKEVLDLLDKQLQRCGPSQLGAAAPQCPACPECPAPPAAPLVAVVLVLFAAGVVVGLAAGRGLCVTGTPVLAAAPKPTKKAEEPETRERLVLSPKLRRQLALGPG